MKRSECNGSKNAGNNRRKTTPRTHNPKNTTQAASPQPSCAAMIILRNDTTIHHPAPRRSTDPTSDLRRLYHCCSSLSYIPTNHRLGAIPILTPFSLCYTPDALSCPTHPGTIRFVSQLSLPGSILPNCCVPFDCHSRQSVVTLPFTDLPDTASIAVSNHNRNVEFQV